MKRILLTGLSGVGKSSVVAALSSRGYHAVDTDTAEWSHWAEVDPSAPGTPVEPGRDWVWDPTRIDELLDTDGDEVLFVAGTSPNMGRFRSRFDRVILLSAPAETMAERLRSRTNNPYGQQAHERRRAIELVETVEPLLRAMADTEIDTGQPLEDVVRRVLEVARRA